MSKPEKLSEAELEGIRKANVRFGHCDIVDLFGHAEAQASELAAKDAEIARLREALAPFADAYRNHTRINWDDEECQRASSVLEGDR